MNEKDYKEIQELKEQLRHGLNRSYAHSYYGRRAVRAAGSVYRRYFHLPINAADPGGLGATWVAPSGYNLDAVTELLYFEAKIYDDWDGVSDLTLKVMWYTDESNAGGNDADVVVLTLVSYYNGIGDVALKEQTSTISTTIGKAARYKVFETEFTIDYDLASNVVDKGDGIWFSLKFVTADSHVTDIVISNASFSYKTNHPYIEAGDI